MTFDRRSIESRLILLGKAGSQSYRTNIEGSDLDGRGIFIAGKEHYLGMSKIEQKEGWEGEGKFSFIDRCKDLVAYELQKYIGLAIDANPNILEQLFLDEEDYEYVHPLGRHLIEHRHFFVSKRIRWTYIG